MHKAQEAGSYSITILIEEKTHLYVISRELYFFLTTTYILYFQRNVQTDRDKSSYDI